jgi:hypothetical protein
MSQNAVIETMLKMAADQNRLTIYTYRSWNLERDAEAAFVTAFARPGSEEQVLDLSAPKPGCAG